MVRWIEYLQQSNFKIDYRPGKENFVADALSRLYSTQLLVIQEDKYFEGPLFIPNYLQHRRFNDHGSNEIQECIKKRIR